MFGHFFVHVQNPGHFGFVLPHMYLQALEIPETAGVQTEFLQLTTDS